MRPAALAALLLASGCASVGVAERISAEASEDIRRSDRRSEESHTLSRLAAIERSLNDFVRARGVIPKTLDELVPDYLAEIPEAEPDLERHRSSGKVRYYEASVIVEGRLDSASLEDAGGWGYAYNDRQIIVFVDCTHAMTDGRPWHQARGVY